MKFDPVPVKRPFFLPIDDLINTVPLYSKTSVFVRPHVKEKPAFSKMFTLGTIFENPVYMWTNWAKTEGRHLRFLKNIRRLVDGALASSLFFKIPRNFQPRQQILPGFLIT